MRRLLLVVLALGLLIAGTFLVTFSVSRHRVKGQGYLTSLADFVVMIDSYRRQTFDVPPPPLDDARYAAVMGRFRSTTHSEVEERLVWLLERWGEDVVPRLVSDLGPGVAEPRWEGAARALGEIGSAAAAAALGEALCGMPRDPRPPVRRRVLVLVGALGRTGEPAAAGVLERCAAERVRAGELDASTYRAALGQSGGGAEALLAELRATRDADELSEMLWELAETRDERVARAMAPLLRHPLGRIRQRARDALDQSMGPAAIDPVLDLLVGEEDGYVIAAVVHHLFDDRDARDNPRVVSVLEGLVDHPALGWDAVYALSRLGGPEAVGVLRAHARDDPDAVLEHVDVMGEEGLPIAGDLLASSDPWLRRSAIEEAVSLHAPGARPLVAPFRDDPDEVVARAAEEALLRLDKIALHASWAASLPGDLGRQAWRAFRPDYFGYDRGIERMWPVLTWVHRAGVALSAMLGILLVFKMVALFEPYRFQVFVLFLLAEGFVGDFFFMDHGRHPWLSYQVATGVHLLLLIGFLCLPRDLAPGELRGRFEALGGASVWLLVPLLLTVGTPLLAQALRRSLSDYSNLRAWLWLIVVLVVLVFEQWLVPWHALPRRAGVERAVRGILSATVLGLLALALVEHAGVLRAEGRDDDAVQAGLLVLPLAFILLVHLHTLGVLRRRGTSTRLVPAPGRLRVLQDGESVRIRRERVRPRAVRALRLVVVLAPAVVAGAVAGGSGKATGMVLAFVAGPLGAALGALTVLLLERPFVLQVRHRWVRGAKTLLGASVGQAGWRRRVPTLEARTRAAPEWSDLGPEEKGWLLDVVGGGSGSAPGGAPRDARLILELRLGPAEDPGSGLVATRLRVTNQGDEPVSPADLDDHARGVAWRARADGDLVPLYMSREEREGRIAPGGRVVLAPRVHLGGRRAEGVVLRVTCPAGVSNEVTLAPPRGPR